MRASPVVVLALVVSACVASVEGGPSEPSIEVAAVTTTAVVATTTQAGTTTTSLEGSCPEASRGFTCPPDLPVSGRDVGGTNPSEPLRVQNPATLAPGTYRTGLFPVPFTFVVAEPVRSFGEDQDGQIVDLGGPGSTYGVYVMDRSVRAAIDRDEEHYGVNDQVEVTVFESTAFMTVFTVDSDWRTDVDNPSGIIFAFIEPDHRAAVIDVEVDGQQITVLISPPLGEFDTYFETVALPLLESIVFLDQ